VLLCWPWSKSSSRQLVMWGAAQMEHMHGTVPASQKQQHSKDGRSSSYQCSTSSGRLLQWQPPPHSCCNQLAVRLCSMPHMRGGSTTDQQARVQVGTKSQSHGLPVCVRGGEPHCSRGTSSRRH
jgi:hypothetical protein